MATKRSRKVLTVLLALSAGIFVVGLSATMWPLSAAGVECGSVLQPTEATRAPVSFDGIAEPAAPNTEQRACTDARGRAETLGWGLMIGSWVLAIGAYGVTAMTEPLANGSDFWRSRRWMKLPPDDPNSERELGRKRR